LPVLSSDKTAVLWCSGVDQGLVGPETYTNFGAPFKKNYVWKWIFI